MEGSSELEVSKLTVFLWGSYPLQILWNTQEGLTLSKQKGRVNGGRNRGGQEVGSVWDVNNNKKEVSELNQWVHQGKLSPGKMAEQRMMGREGRGSKQCRERNIL